jgi:hypothetical protein
MMIPRLKMVPCYFTVLIWGEQDYGLILEDECFLFCVLLHFYFYLIKRSFTSPPPLQIPLLSPPPLTKLDLVTKQNY